MSGLEAVVEAQDAVCTVRGEELLLLPERAIYWRRRRTLLVADPHFGKAASFRSAGVPVPAGTTEGTLARIDATLARTGATRLVFLGDFLHARQGRSVATLSALGAWRARHAELDVVLVRGNHDHRAGDPPAELRVCCVDAPLIEAPLGLVHHPVEVPGVYALAGHLHPAAVMIGRGRQRARFPCFWFSGQWAVLPAFGEFTGLASVEPGPGDQVFVIAGGAVHDVTRP
ncbi:MAG TPA: ligase-associated DNA damage response endonuclease PdeM [Gemmatimonadaceae bacterium]|nr:ligase-associated DNA damage response endonuclease PdeM [Gemmatimonadaceae bacterium]